ncbi:MAG TPA: hydantoinase B/oxoprolinase family protein [Solirubrobacteraceae bacterium]
MSGGPDLENGYLPPQGPLRTLPLPSWSAAGVEPDAVTFEVVRHRIYGIVEEQGVTITRVSGSPVATFAHDFATSVLTAAGETVYFGPYNQPQVGSIDLVTKWVMEYRGAVPGIRDGDMFLCNDPWIGVSHQADVVIVCPVFHEQKLLCWVASTIHAADVGGSTPGGFCPDARSVFDEPLPTPALKYVEDGEVRRDLEEMFLRRSRLPELLQLDLRALIASNNVARERMLTMVERFGAEIVAGTMAKVIDDAERVVARRLAQLPDGEWSERRYLDIAGLDDRGVYPIVMHLRKQGGELTFSNEGTHPQVGALNTTVAGWRAGTLAAANPMLGYDLMYAAGGLLRRIAFESVPGTVLSACHPASVSNNMMGSSGAHSLAISCLSRMLGASPDPELRRRAMAGAATPFNVTVLSGADARGRRFGSLLLDPMGAGFGAFAGRDGQDTGGRSWDPIATMPNVEYNERYFPILCLYRREAPESGGAGALRGGNSGIVAFTPHQTDAITVDISSGGWALPWAAGLFGGLPGCTNGSRHLTGTTRLAELLAAGRVPQSLDELGGEARELPPRQRDLQLQAGEIFELGWSAGGGFGDPFARDPLAVLADVSRQKLSAEAARALYGVELGPQGVDEAATAALRGARAQTQPFEAIPRLSADRSAWLCPACDAKIGSNEPQGGGYLADTKISEMAIEALSRWNREPRRFVDHEIVLRVHSCRACGCNVEAHVVDLADPRMLPAMRVEPLGAAVAAGAGVPGAESAGIPGLGGGNPKQEMR